MTILRAKYVVPMAQPPIEDGAVVVGGDSIIAVGPTREIRAAHAGDLKDLGEVVLSPGLINAHCHLDYSDLKDKVEWHGSFMEWLLKLVSLKKQRTEEQYRAAIVAGLDQLRRSGTTTVVNVESFPQVIDHLPESSLRIWWCLELIDFNRGISAEELARQAEEFIAAHPVAWGGFGLSPHAPYTASAALCRLAAQYTRARNIPLTTHLAESEEEDDMFRRGAGPMYDYFLRAGRDMSDCKRIGPVQLMAECEVLGPSFLAVHANCLTPQDITLLKNSGSHIVHCPKSHRFFGRRTAWLPAFWQNNMNVCLGTDSLASNDTLDMFAEMQAVAREFPRLEAEQILRMATVCGGKALNLPDKLGMITPGAWADLIAVPWDGVSSDPYEAVVFAERRVRFSMVGGKAVVDENE
jgi:cytosine/adenosine deaminase-related metal-dependent hydrolase